MSSDSLDIIPFRNNAKINVDIPGSKSISNRALILSVLNYGKVNLKGILESDDVNIMIVALRKLGVKIERENKNSIVIFGTGGKLSVKKATLNVGNAGTVARFLTALLALQDDGEYSLDGSVAMRERPMEGLINALEIHGAKFSFNKKLNHFPFKIISNGLNLENWDIDASLSSQILSAILLISPCILGETKIQLKKDTVSKPFVKMTIEMMRQFSTESEFNVVEDNNSYLIGNFKFKHVGGLYNIEPDATAASYFLSLPIAIRGSVLVKNIQNCQLQGDINYSRVISSCGVTVKKENFGLIASVDSEIYGGDFNFNDISDTFLTLAALSPILKTPLKISGIAHTRNQETDRVSGMVTQLRKIASYVKEAEDSIYIEPHKNLNKYLKNKLISIETYDDHRFAMSFSVLGSFDLYGSQTPWIKILDPMCCAKTFPEFFEVLSLCRTNAA